eukprot:UN07534
MGSPFGIINSKRLKYQWFQQQAEDSLVYAVAIAFDNSVAVTAEKNHLCGLGYCHWQK